MTGEPKPRRAGTSFRFRTKMDERVCPICGPFNGKIMPLSAKLQSTIPRGPVYQDVPPIHPNCRCQQEIETWKWTKQENRIAKKLVQNKK